MNVIKFHKSMTSTPGAGRSVKFAMTNLAVNFLRLQTFGKTNVIKLNQFEDSDSSAKEFSSNAKLNDQHKEVLMKFLNHLAHGTKLKLTQSDLDTFDEVEAILKPDLSSDDSMVMLYLYITARCSLEDVSAEVIKAWQGFLKDFSIQEPLIEEALSTTPL